MYPHWRISVKYFIEYSIKARNRIGNFNSYSSQSTWHVSNKYRTLSIIDYIRLTGGLQFYEIIPTICYSKSCPTRLWFIKRIVVKSKKYKNERYYRVIIFGQAYINSYLKPTYDLNPFLRRHPSRAGGHYGLLMIH